MRQQIFQPKQLHLVLIGGGHAQIQLLKSLGMNPIDGLAITLITDVLNAPYSGMLPAYVAGLCDYDDLHIDLVRLSCFAGATLIHAPVTAIDPNTQMVHIANRPEISYDILSINCGAVPDLAPIKGAKAHSISVKPIAHFIEKLPKTIAENTPINIIGAGVAGIELAFSFHTRYKSQNIDINVFSRSDRILPKMRHSTSRRLEALARDRGITIHNKTRITEIGAKNLVCASSKHYPSGMNFVVTGVVPGGFMQGLSKTLDDRGFIAVKDTLQTQGYETIFASGDIASLTDHPREKAGVFAVRAGKILTKNIRRLIQNQPLVHWRPQKHYLALIGTGDGKAVAIRNGHAAHHALFWQWKVKIDQAFMTKFSDLPQMTAQKPAALPFYEKADHNLSDAIFSDMRCAGCAAKASATLLDTAMATARQKALALGLDKRLLAPDDALSEDAGLTAPISAPLRHSFDSLSSMVSDPFIFAKIAANHALSDLYVAGADPLFAQAHITLEEASEPRQLDQAISLLTGSLLSLGDANATLLGGHTSQGIELSLGFAVTGAQKRILMPFDAQTDYVIITTKRLGIGTALAGHMRQQLPAHSYRCVMDDMLLSNEAAAKACFAAGAIGLTDVTGFGLARHLSTLLTRLHAQTNQPFKACLSLAALQIFDDIEPLVRAGVRSSLFTANQTAAAMLTTPSAATDWRTHLLSDPQTSGGIIAIIPQSQEAALLKTLSQLPAPHHPAMIGTVAMDGLSQSNSVHVEIGG